MAGNRQNGRVFQVTETYIKRMMSRGEPLFCETCNRLLQPGDYIVTKLRHHEAQKSETIYHDRECWEKKFF